MKAIDSIRNKVKKPSLTTILFWIGCFIALLGAIIQFQLFPFLLVVAGLMIAAWQKVVGDREQQQQLEQERNRSDAVAQDFVIRSKLKGPTYLNITPDPMPESQSQVTHRKP